MTFYFAMTNSWSLLYDEIYGEDTMTEDIRITSLESDEYDPIVNFTVGAGNTADTIHITTTGAITDFNSEVFNVPQEINTEEPICIKTNDDPWVYESPDNGSTVTRRKAGDDYTKKEVIHGDYFGDSYPYVDTINIDTSGYPSPFTTFSDNDDAIAHHITTPTPGIELDNPRKYKEDESIKALQDYISTTYGGHYTSDNNNVQTLDLIESVGDAESFCRSNAIKYLSRYDKKGQARRDILKALHYSLLLYHFSGQLKETTTRGYETF
jgi:hypothetical protein